MWLYSNALWFFFCKYYYKIYKIDKGSTFLHLHHGGKFVKQKKLKHEDGTYRTIYPIEIDKLSFCELKESLKGS